MDKDWRENEARKRFKENLNKLISHGRSKIISQQIGVTESTLSSWKKSHRTGVPTILDAVKLAHVLNISLAELAGISNRDDAFNHPTIQAIADISADLPQDKLRYMQRIAHRLPELTAEQIEKITEILELMSPPQKVTYAPPVKDTEPILDHSASAAESPIHSPPTKRRTSTPNYTSAAAKYVRDDVVQKTVAEYHTGDYVEVPYYAAVTAGPPIDMNDSNGIHRVPSEYIKDNSSHYYTLCVTGNSMIQIGITDRCNILVRTGQGLALTNGGIYVIRHNNKTTIKKLIIEISVHGTLEYWITWCNGSHHKEEIVDSDWVILGEYVRVINAEFKSMRVTAGAQ